MTPLQKKLARHALGLPNDDRRSYRNRYIIGNGGRGFSALMRMVRDGNATRERFGAHTHNRYCFHLTLTEAAAVLEDGESLDREDFGLPPNKRHAP